MSALVHLGWGLTITGVLVQAAATLAVAWAVADRRGVGDEFLDGLRSIVQLPIGATPGGGQ